MRRWLVMTLLLHSAVPALAQLNRDPENPDVVLPDPPKTVKNPVPVSVVNAGQAVESPKAGEKHKPNTTTCSDANPCATPTPAAR